MRHLYACAAAGLAIFCSGGIAQAATFTPADCAPGNIHFCVSGDATAPSVDSAITAMLTNTFEAGQTIDDTFLFRIDRDGVASTGIQTTFSSKNTYFALTDLIINGVSYASMVTNTPAGASVNINGLPIIGGAMNSIRIIGAFNPPSNRGQTNYIGNLTFTAAVPEVSTWAMMMFGVYAIGAAMRRRKPLRNVRFRVPPRATAR